MLFSLHNDGKIAECSTKAYKTTSQMNGHMAVTIHLETYAVINMFITFTITFKRHPVNIYLHNYVTKKSTVKAWHSDLLMKAIVAEHSCHTS